MTVTVSDDQLKLAFFDACADWFRWRADYEFAGTPRLLPVIQDAVRFDRFVIEYNPFRQRTPRDTHRKIREYLSCTNTMEHIVGDPSGKSLETESEFLRDHYPDVGRPISALSKLAMFAEPDVFSPYDSFARKGLAVVARADEGYRDYAELVEEVWLGPIGQRIRAATRDAGSITPTLHPGLARRVLDSLLMQLGGRRPIDAG